jgi:hypothetical protein
MVTSAAGTTARNPLRLHGAMSPIRNATDRGVLAARRTRVRGWSFGPNMGDRATILTAQAQSPGADPGGSVPRRASTCGETSKHASPPWPPVNGSPSSVVRSGLILNGYPNSHWRCAIPAGSAPREGVMAGNPREGRISQPPVSSSGRWSTRFACTDGSGRTDDSAPRAERRRRCSRILTRTFHQPSAKEFPMSISRTCRGSSSPRSSASHSFLDRCGSAGESRASGRKRRVLASPGSPVGVRRAVSGARRSASGPRASASTPAGAAPASAGEAEPAGRGVARRSRRSARGRD